MDIDFYILKKKVTVYAYIHIERQFKCLIPVLNKYIQYMYTRKYDYFAKGRQDKSDGVIHV
jgi:hypothetical protein